MLTHIHSYYGAHYICYVKTGVLLGVLAPDHFPLIPKTINTGITGCLYSSEVGDRVSVTTVRTEIDFGKSPGYVKSFFCITPLLKRTNYLPAYWRKFAPTGKIV